MPYFYAWNQFKRTFMPITSLLARLNKINLSVLLFLWGTFWNVRMANPRVFLTKRDFILLLCFIFIFCHQHFPQTSKGIENLVACLGAYLLEKGNFVFHHKLLQIFLINRIYCHIAFICQDHNLAFGFSVLINFCNPKWKKKKKTVFVINWINKDNSISSSIVSRYYWPKCFRPSSVPNLHLYLLSSDL